MSPGFLLDNNVFSDAWAPRPNVGMLRRLREHALDLTTAAPVVHELVYGARRLPPSHRREQIERSIVDVLARIPILSYDAPAAMWHASERVRLTALGRTPPFVDGQIAAIAATNGLVLVTANTADFQPFHGLQLEDWRS